MEDRQLELYFSSIKNDFNRMDERFDVVDRRFEAIDRRFEAIDRRFDSQDETLGGIRQGVSTILELMQGYDREQREVKATLWEHDRRLAKLEQSS